MKTLRLRRFALRAARAGLVLFVVGWLGLKLVPIPAALNRPNPGSLQLVDRHGAPLRETRSGDAFARPVRSGEVPDRVVRAMLAAEDKRFFEHSGVDLLATLRAARDSFQNRRVVSGASTITQQLVKIAVPRPRTFRTKAIEAVTALRLEQLWSKERILEEYLNRVDFGNMNIGIAAAADYYFGKPLSDLSDAEAALLAGLPKNPRRLNPHRSIFATRSRQQTVLRRMHENRWLTSDEYSRAVAEEARLRPPSRQFRAPHFVDLALKQVAGIGTVRTTLDLSLTRFVEREMRDQLSPLRTRHATNAAVVVIENETGSIRTLVGSEDYFAAGSGQFNGATANRSPGSTIKPFTYLLALEKAATPATIYPDVPTEFPTPSGNYRVDNYQRRCSGPVTLRSALACSLNIPAVHALNEVGGPAVLQRRLTALGLTTLSKSPDDYGLGLTLGNAEAKLLELTNAYAALARLGEFRPWRVFEDETTSSRLAADPRACWLIAEILRDNDARIPSFGVNSALRFDFPVACKTGTSTDYRDNWAMAYTPEFTVGVWVGNFDGSAMQGVSGVSGAAPLMHAIFEHLHARFGTTWYATPPNVVETDIHPLTGKRLTSPRSDSRHERFLGEKLPAFESSSDYLPNGAVALGSEYREWLASEANTLATRVGSSVSGPTLKIVSPVSGTTFVIDPDLPGSRRIRLATADGRVVRWESASLICRDGEADAAEGEHRLFAVDPVSGERAETWIRVKSL